MKIKDKQEEDKNEVLDKNELIIELREINKELQRQNEIKNEEIRVLIDKMEKYKKTKDSEIAKLK